MIKQCPQCDHKGLLTHIEVEDGQHQYTCRSCGKVSKTVEVLESYLRELVMAKMGHSAPASA